MIRPILPKMGMPVYYFYGLLLLVFFVVQSGQQTISETPAASSTSPPASQFPITQPPTPSKPDTKSIGNIELSNWIQYQKENWPVQDGENIDEFVLFHSEYSNNPNLFGFNQSLFIENNELIIDPSLHFKVSKLPLIIIT